MAKFDNHPTVKWWRERSGEHQPTTIISLNSAALRTLCIEAGADDVGFVEIDRATIADQSAEILSTFAPTKTLVSFVCRMNKEDVRTPARSIANLEFHANYDHANEVARNIVKALAQIGVRALNPASAFSMEMDRFPGKVWVVSHKPVAVAAGLGHMGTHNYREFMSGFTDWTETIVESKNVKEYRQKVSATESASMWQSLSFKANYKAAYCIAACPAGEDVIGAFLTSRTAFVREVVKPLQDKSETIYVIPGSDAETYVAKRFPHKKVKLVSSGIRPQSIQGFIFGLPLLFQQHQSIDVNMMMTKDGFSLDRFVCF